jgi:hypothetical protein
MTSTSTERMRRLRRRRRRGRAAAYVELDPIEIKKLVALGYLDPTASGDKGPAFDAAAEAYLSDRLAKVLLTDRSAPLSERARDLR